MAPMLAEEDRTCTPTPLENTMSGKIVLVHDLYHAANLPVHYTEWEARVRSHSAIYI